MSVFSAEFNAKVKWHIYRFFDQIGWLGRGALLAFFLLVALFFMRWNDVQQKIATATVESAPLISAANPQLNQSTMLEEWLVQFPKGNEKAKTFNAFMQLAKEQELTLDTVTYKTKRSESAAPLSQTTMEFTLYASYTQVHDFMNKVMLEMPFVAIEQLSFTRENDADEVIEARVKLLFNFALE